MASYHLCVKTVKRSAGRSSTAAAAYRAGERIDCAREGLVHDYTRKQGVEDSFILTPPDAPAWARDRTALWNAAEASERRLNSVVAREWELALPADLSATARADLARAFAQAVVDRYGVAADVAIHLPHREGDQRNHHAHILTTTRALGAEGLGAKTRILDAAKTGGAEIADMRGLWAGMQNEALEHAGREERVDHRSLEDQREAALVRGDELAAAELDRPPEIKLGPATSAVERKALQEAARDGVDYTPVTERGAQNHQIRQQRDLLADLRQRAERAREAYVQARAQEASRFSAAVDAVRAAFENTDANQAFAEGFEAAMQAQDDARRRALEAEQARDRQRQLDQDRARFIELAAQAWQASHDPANREVAEARQSEITKEVERAAERYGVGFSDLAAPISERAREIHAERQREIEIEHVRERDDGLDYGL